MAEFCEESRILFRPDSHLSQSDRSVPLISNKCLVRRITW